LARPASVKPMVVSEPTVVGPSHIIEQASTAVKVWTFDLANAGDAAARAALAAIVEITENFIPASLTRDGVTSAGRGERDDAQSGQRPERASPRMSWDATPNFFARRSDGERTDNPALTMWFQQLFETCVYVSFWH
jgi:hypothetical protein